MKKSLFVDGVCFAFILLFVYAAMSKLMDFEKFRVQLGQSPLLTAYAGAVAWIVPAIEIIISVLLSIPRFRMQALYASFTLMVAFSAYIIAITKFSDFIPCSCGGILQKMGWGQHLVFNICFVLLSAAAILLYKENILVKNSKNEIMKKSMAVFAFLLTTGSAFTTNSGKFNMFMEGYLKSSGGICTAGIVEQQSCPGGAAFCTINGGHPVFPTLADCANNRNVFAYNP